MSNAETSLQERVIQLVENKGGYVVTQHGSMITRGGIPDLLICYQGLFIAMELKTPIGTISRKQEIQARLIKKSGGYVCFPKSVEEAEMHLSKAVGDEIC